jgi:DNA-binding NarL/FixJ family response regulator
MPDSRARRIRVLTADDHAEVRAGITAMIANEPDMDVVGEACDGAEAVLLFGKLIPDVVLMDLRMPTLDGVTAIRAIRAGDPDARILALTTYEGEAEIERAMIAGACAYLLKDALVAELSDAIRRAASGR